MKNKARISFNGEEKIIEITDEFYTEHRVSNEMAGMAMEECKLLNLPKQYENIPILNLPKDILDDVFAETEIDRQYEIVYEKYINNMISVIEKGFSLKINSDCFWNEEYNVSKSDMDNNIVIHIHASDNSTID
jgi:hypothetical protein